MNEEQLKEAALQAWQKQLDIWENIKKKNEEELIAKKEKAFAKLKNQFPTLKGPVNIFSYFFDGTNYDYEIYELLGYKFRLFYNFNNSEKEYMAELSSWDISKQISISPFCGYPVRDLKSLGGFLTAMKETEKQ